MDKSDDKNDFRKNQQLSTWDTKKIQFNKNFKF